MEDADPAPAAATIYLRIATLSSWYRWLEDEDVLVGNPAARVQRPQRHPSPQPWLNRTELADLLAAAEDEGGHVYRLALAASITRRMTPHALHRSDITIGLLQGVPCATYNALPATPRLTWPHATGANLTGRHAGFGIQRLDVRGGAGRRLLADAPPPQPLPRGARWTAGP